MFLENPIYKTVNCPGIVMLIAPPHIQVQVSPPETTAPIGKRTVGFAEIQGATTAGTHGIGVNVKTPRAAAVAAVVAAATIGFARLVHIPNVKIFNIGTKSTILATGKPHAKTGIFGRTTKEDGVIPQEHLQRAPQTAIGMFFEP